VIDKHGEALEADLIDRGLRLRWCPSPDFTWRDLHLFVKFADMDSKLMRSMYPDKAGWTLTNQLLAIIADVLRWLQWAKTKDGMKGYNQPEPIPRPGVVPLRRPVHPGAKGLPRSKLRKVLGLKPREDRATRLKQLFTKGRYGD
jgi:hypothetical protein